MGVGIFGKDNIEKNKEDDLGTKVQKELDGIDNLGIGTNTNGVIRANNSGTRINIDVKADKKTKVDNLSIEIHVDTSVDRKI